MLIFTFSIGQVLIAVFDGCEVSVPDEHAEHDAVEQEVVPEGVAEGDEEDSQADAEDGDEGDDAVGELQLRDVVDGHAEVEHDDRDGQQQGHGVGGDVVVA